MNKKSEIECLSYPILREIGTLTRTITTISESKFKQLGIQKGQFFYITRVCENPGINQKNLSNLVKVDKTTTAKSLTKLIKAGFLLKKRDLKDQRAFLLYPSERGLYLYKKIIQEENRQLAVYLKDFSEEENSLMLMFIKRMIHNSEKEWIELKK